jgi:hypothetical protein
MSGAVWRHRKSLSTDVLSVIEYACNTDLSAGEFFTFRQTVTDLTGSASLVIDSTARKWLPEGLELFYLPPLLVNDESYVVGESLDTASFTL